MKAKGNCMPYSITSVGARADPSL